MKKNLLITLAFLATSSLYAQNYEKTQNGVKTQTRGMEIEVQFYTPSIVRIVKYPELTVLNKQSLSVVKQPEAVKYQSSIEGDVVCLSTEYIQVALNTVTGKVSFADKQKNPLFTEREYSTQFTPAKDADKESFIVRQAFLLDKEEAIYGLGQQQNGKLSQRGEKIFLRNSNTRVCIPFFQSVKGYGVFWDNYSPTTFWDKAEETSFESTGDCTDYYFLYGGNGDGVIAQMRELTGHSPMLPLWAYGFLQSRERYKSQKEVVAVVEKYRALQVPLDGIIQDWQYWGGDNQWNAMEFLNPKYTNPKTMVDRVHQLNAHIMISTWASFGPDTKPYKELKAKKMLLDFDTWPPGAGVKVYDTFDPAARDIYWKYMNKNIFALGMDSWWLDSSEPDHVNVKDKDFDENTYLGSLRSVYNAFPLEHVRGVYENQREVTSAKRVLILTRSAFAGQQRYGANTWSGDLVSTWESLSKSVPAGLNFSLNGIPYWNADIGGFFTDPKYPQGVKDKTYHELYVRWFQFGTFTPMMRSHGTHSYREIYQFGERGDDWAFDVQEKFINLRYALLPYLYSTANNVSTQSASFMRALFMDFAADKKTHNINNEYMFGQSFLVAPVLEPMYVTRANTWCGEVDTEDFSTIKTREVYLPNGTKWIDFWTGDTFNGGQTINKEAPIDIIPLYVKAGTILPWGPKVQYATEKKWDNLEIRVYPGADGEFTLYEDENDNYNYEKGIYSTITFKWNDKSKELIIDDRKGEFPGMLRKRTFNIVLVDNAHGTSVISGKITKAVVYKGKSVIVTL